MRVCVRYAGDMLYLWNLFCCYGGRKDVGGKIGLAETNHTGKWHIDSINYVFFSHHIQTLIEYNCYQSNQWFYSHERGCVEADLFVASHSACDFDAESESSVARSVFIICAVL